MALYPRTIPHSFPSTPARAKEQRVPMTYEEYVAYDPPEDRLVEWVNGEAIFHMAPRVIHQTILGFLSTLFHMFVTAYQHGFVMSAPTEMHHLPSASREPDLLFLFHHHRYRVEEKRINGPADLVVEIISPDSVWRDHNKKFGEYEQAGIQEYWIIDPRENKRHMLLYTLSPLQRYIPVTPDAKGLYHSQLLPGFWIDPVWLWQDPLPDSWEILSQLVPTKLLDEATLNEMKMESRKEGMEEGVQRGKEEVALSMLAEGLDIGVVAKWTGLSPEQVAMLAAQE